LGAPSPPPPLALLRWLGTSTVEALMFISSYWAGVWLCREEEEEEGREVRHDLLQNLRGPRSEENGSSLSE